MEWIDCVRWCHSAEEAETVNAIVELLVDHCRSSGISSPIMTKMCDEFGIRFAGYVVLYPGALASVGHLRSESIDLQTAHDPLADLAKGLFQDAFDKGVEMVQAISPLIVSRMWDGLPSSRQVVHSLEANPTIPDEMDTAFSSSDPQRDLVLRSSGMMPVAKLVEMACSGIQSNPKIIAPASGLDFGEIEFIPHHRFQPSLWRQVVESTYVETSDVPELNGLRSIESTLAGYAAMIVGVPESWWIVQCKSEYIGCLLLTPTAAGCCEITYLGLLPKWRGKGLSKAVMNFVLDWAKGSGIEAIQLAVDLRNIPAIRLYQSCGFTTERFVQAWIAFPKKS